MDLVLGRRPASAPLVLIDTFTSDGNKSETEGMFKASLTFKCLIEHLLADFSYSRPLDTFL